MKKSLIALLLALAAPAHAVNLQTFDQILNSQRGSFGLGGVQPNRALMAAAQAHAEDMSRRSYFSHVGTGGTTVGDRAERQGFCYRKIAENIAWGYGEEVGNMTGWMNSTGHRQNILLQGATDYGVGNYGGVWVMIVARPC